MKTKIPDRIIEIIVVKDISEEYIKMYATMKIHNKTMNPICVGESFFLAIKYEVLL